MVTYEHVNEVVRNRCVKHKAKRWDSRAILLLIATSGGALIIQNNFETVKKYPKNVSKKLKMIFHPELEISPY